MKVVIQESHRRIQPFADPAGDTPIANRPLSVWQEEALRAAKLVRVSEPSAPCLLIPDNLFATGEALLRFIAAAEAQAKGENAVLVLRPGSFATLINKVQPGVVETSAGYRYNAVRLKMRDDESAWHDVVVDSDEKSFAVPLPRAVSREQTYEIGIPKYPFVLLDHWVHILWLNLVIGGIEIFNTPPWLVAARTLWAVLKAMSFNKWRVMRKLNLVGRGCDIHPTAVVEASILEDGVSVGAHAYVMASRLGRGSAVLPGAQVVVSMLGESCVVSEASVVRFCMLYSGANASQQLMQRCVLGRDVVTTKGGGTIDLNFDADIKVALDGQMHTTGTNFLGSAFGHRSRIGTGFFLACGRTIPNDYFVIRDPKLTLSTIPPGLEGAPVVGSRNRAEPCNLLGARLKSSS